jgi:hypothetical protein
MVSVFIEAVPANLSIAKAVCDYNRSRGNHADYTAFGMQIRILKNQKFWMRTGINDWSVTKTTRLHEINTTLFLFIVKRQTKEHGKNRMRFLER